MSATKIILIYLHVLTRVRNMDKSTQLTLFDCARKRCKTSCATDSETIDNVVVDLDSELESQVSNMADLEQIEL